MDRSITIPPTSQNFSEGLINSEYNRIFKLPFKWKTLREYMFHEDRTYVVLYTTIFPDPGTVLDTE